jgi:hypothetical protein
MQQLARGAARLASQQLRMAARTSLRPMATTPATTPASRLVQPFRLTPPAALGLARLRSSGGALLTPRLQRALRVSARAQAGAQPGAVAAAAAQQEEAEAEAEAAAGPTQEFVVVNFYQ